MRANRRRFEPAEFDARQEKVRRAMSERGIELLILTNPSNMCWLSGFDGWSFYVHQCLVIGTDGELFWFGRGIDAPTARMTTDLPDADVVAYPDHYVQSAERHPMDFLSQIIKQRGLDKKHIGVEKDNYFFTARAMESLQTHLTQAHFSDATWLVNWQRAIKSPQELVYMRRAGLVIEEMYKRVIEVAEPGMRENELAGEIMYASARGTPEVYGDYPAIVPLMGRGDEAAACHLTWNDGILNNNEGMFLELAGAHARYHCPVSRTLYFGEPPEKYRRIEAVILEGISKTLEMFKPGNTCGEVASTFFDVLHKHGYEKDNRCGYSIGLSYPPDWGEHTMSLRSDDRAVLQENMTFHFMPGMWFEDWGFETTESVLVTAQGGECLSNVPRKLLVK
ncbi:M24 family metallopeptidase [Granulosicoccaceae sp. 1_MG-2023]|nr:M24 family metallopeptidase [Granulosicoccaceae sp. 1_MG-2023]